MKHVIYRITYLPHLGTEYPKYYIGSKFDYKGNYFGSVSSEKIFDFTGFLTLKEWWKLKIKEEPENFLFEILEAYTDLNARELAKIEKAVQEEYNVVNSIEYFNQSIATLGFVSTKNNEYSRLKKSLATYRYWNTPEGMEKRKRLSERNRQTKSKEAKERYSGPNGQKYNVSMYLAKVTMTIG